MRVRNNPPGKAEKALIEMIRPEDLRPRFSNMAKETGIPVSSLFGAWKKLQDENRIRVTVEYLLVIERFLDFLVIRSRENEKYV